MLQITSTLSVAIVGRPSYAMLLAVHRLVTFCRAQPNGTCTLAQWHAYWRGVQGGMAKRYSAPMLAWYSPNFVLGQAKRHYKAVTVRQG